MLMAAAAALLLSTQEMGGLMAGGLTAGMEALLVEPVCCNPLLDAA